MVLRKGQPGDVALIRNALFHLRTARDLLRRVGAKKSLDRVRHALKSAEGAERHAYRCDPAREAERTAVQRGRRPYPTENEVQ
jgi:hypothetical protein